MLKKLKFTSNPDETIQDVRKQLMFWVLIIINIFGIPIVIIGLVEAYTLQQEITAWSYIVLYSPILFATIFRKKISYKLCAASILFSIFLLGVINLIIYGFSGASTPIFFLLLVFTTVFFDIKAGIFAVFISLIPMTVIGYLFIQDILSLDISLNEISTIPISWFTASAVLFLLGILIVLSFGIIQKKMIHSMQFSKKKADELSKLNLTLNDHITIQNETELKLKKLSDNLEETVKKRTKELEDKNAELGKFNDLFIGREFRIKELKEKVKELEGKK